MVNYLLTIYKPWLSSSGKKRSRQRIYTISLFIYFLFNIGVYAQQHQITGTITSEVDNTALPGVNIIIKGTSEGTVTDLEGKYKITAAPDDILVISFIGYNLVEIPVNDQSLIDVALSEDVAVLDEVVVIGYGVQKKKLVTGATAQIDGEDLTKQNAINPLHAMQGSTPGVQITSTSGQPGKGINVTIRGLGSIYGGNPLYIVDGVIGGDISVISPSDIESIDILKDAASAAIYGAQAANGVVLVTTKTGKKGETKISFDAYYGVQNIADMVTPLNADQYALIMNEQAINSGVSPLYSPMGKSAFLAQYDDTDWLDRIINKNAPMYEYNLSLSGGNDVSIYSMSVGMNGQDGVVGGHDVSSYQRVNFRLNTEHKLYDGFVKVGQHLMVSKVNSTGVGEGGLYSGSPIRAALGTSPLLPMYDDNGNYLNNTWVDPESDNVTEEDYILYKGENWDPWNPGESNPYAEMMTGESRSTNNKIFGDIYAEINPLPGLKVKSTLGIDYYSSGSRAFQPVYQYSMYAYNNNDYATQNLGQGGTWSWENTISYDLTAGDHQFNVLAGNTMREYQGEWMYTKNADLIFPDYEHAWIDNTTNTSNSSLWSFSGGPSEESMMMSYFGRLSYNFKEKYMLNTTYRADGSSKFAEGHRWGYFPSVSAGWVISNESFMESLALLDFLKIRASWGQVGNQNIPAWKYLATIGTSNADYYYGIGVPAGSLSAPGSEYNTTGAYPSQLGNVALRWETSEQSNLGFDARFFGHLGVNIDLYKKITKDWLIEAPVLVTAGDDKMYINGGDVTNQGVELGLNYSNRTNYFDYTVSGNVSYNQNTVGDIPTEDGIIHGNGNEAYNNAEAIYRVAEEGFPIGYFWGWKTNGILQNQQEVDEYVATLGGNATNTLQGRNVAPGDLRYVDVDGNGYIDEDDKTNIGNPNPDLIFGLSFNCSYKAFDFSVVTNGVAGNEIFQSYRNYTGKQANYTTAILDRWHGEGTSDDIPRVTETNINYRISDVFVQKGDYLRISNIQIGFDPAKLVKIKNLSQFRIYVAVQNAFTFTSYDGMDPEVGYGTDASTSGIDLGYYPRPRVVLGGLNLKF